MSIIDTLKTDLSALDPDRKVLIWTKWDWEFPDIQLFKEYLTTAGALLAYFQGEAPPPVPTITVRVTAAAGLRVRSSPDTTNNNNVIGKLAYQQEVSVYEIQEHSGWYKITAEGQFADGYISSAFVVLR